MHVQPVGSVHVGDISGLLGAAGSQHYEYDYLGDGFLELAITMELLIPQAPRAPKKEMPRHQPAWRKTRRCRHLMRLSELRVLDGL